MQRAICKGLGVWLLLGALTTASPASASTTGYGYVSQILVTNVGVVMFSFNGDRINRPACATNAGLWSFDGATPAGQAKLALLMSAYGLNKKINIVGLNTCPQVSSVESVDYFMTE